MKPTEITILIIVAICLIVLLIMPSIPFTNSQFINQSTDFNYFHFNNGDYNGQILYIDNNILTGIDANTLANGAVDGGFSNSVYLGTQLIDGGGA